MPNYGQAAILARKFLVEGRVQSPEEAWEKATAAIFPDSNSSQEKSCPKAAFLGLCEEGLVRGVSPGQSTSSRENKGYAVKAVWLLKSDPALAADENLLWSKVIDGAGKAPNLQMDVVMSLWSNDLIDVDALDLDQRQQETVLRYSMKQAAKVAKENPY
jgi:hypothetical protein